jgi:hypothetical protein
VFALSICPIPALHSTSPNPNLILLQGAESTTSQTDPLEKAEAAKEQKSSSSQAAPDGMKGEAALDDAIGDKGPDPEVTSADDDPLEKAEATKEAKRSS